MIPGVPSVDEKTTVFRVTVPEGTQPGQEFQVYAGDRIVRVRCPPGSNPGEPLQITVPVDPVREDVREWRVYGFGPR
jgi:hypothetical protein